MFKVLAFSSCKDGVEPDALREAYETWHAPLINQLAPPPGPYRRNYLCRDDPSNVNVAALNFDVITELEFEDRAAFQSWIAGLSRPGTIERVDDDLAQFTDLANFRMCIVDVEQS